MSSDPSPFLAPDRLAPLAIGSWLNMVLFTLEALAAIRYFRSKAQRYDSAFIKLGVAQNLVADLVGTVACCAATYLYLVTSWGKVEPLENQHWTLTVIVFTAGAVTAVSQFFMICHYWQMTKHHAVFALLLVVLLGAVTGIFGSGVLMALSPTTKSMLRDVFLFFALLASAAGTLLVSLLLLWQRCKRNAAPVSGSNFIYRIASLFIETGTVTTAVTIVGIALSFGSIRHKMIWITFAFIQARIYSCTMLFVLLRRPESASAARGNAVETAHIITDKHDVASRMMFACTGMPVTLPAPGPPIRQPTVMDDGDAFRLTRKRIELHNRASESDSSSEVSRNLDNELREMAARGRSPRRSCSSEGSMGRHPDIPSRSESPSEYPMSEPRSPFPISPLNLSPRSESPA